MGKNSGKNRERCDFGPRVAERVFQAEIDCQAEIDRGLALEGENMAAASIGPSELSTAELDIRWKKDAHEPGVATCPECETRLRYGPAGVIDLVKTHENKRSCATAKAKRDKVLAQSASSVRRVGFRFDRGRVHIGGPEYATINPQTGRFPAIAANVSSAAIAAKARSRREPQVDVRNILPETSACSRAPTARKRNAEEAIEVRKLTKVKKYIYCTFTCPGAW
ncbi:hypothetical protein B0H13DRAFT_1863073 [Mycena leptocephala]|nr:hypothetical protein B0H13DRAFT_1863073 [Mycena leptocephala]